MGSLGYRILRSWQKESKIEQWSKLLRRAYQLAFPLSAISQNALAGIAYQVPEEVSREVQSMAISWLHSISPSDTRLQLAALDLSLTCSGIFAQKSTSLFVAAGRNIVYPFLNEQLVRLALSSGNWQEADQEAKWLLKAALARHIPSEMVYRAKSGFIAPMSEKFKSNAFLGAFDKLLAGKSLLSPFLKMNFLKHVRGRLGAKSNLPPQTANLVWAIVFVSEWLEQVTYAATGLVSIERSLIKGVTAVG
jgi:hypothetical protein